VRHGTRGGLGPKSLCGKIGLIKTPETLQYFKKDSIPLEKSSKIVKIFIKAHISKQKPLFL
jgi:hypothetical protein